MEFIKRHSKKLIILFILAAIVVSVLYLLIRPEAASTPSATESPSSQAPPSQVETPKEVDADVDTPGAYTDYSESTIADAKGTKLLFFHALWCPQCRELDASIRSSTLPDNLTILKVDYDTNQSLRQKYGVTLQTTVVQIDDAGEKVKSFVAYDSPTFEAVKTAFGL